MKEKITFLMESEGLSTTRLAEILKTRPSSISHLVSGRNKPSYDLLQRISHCFPKISLDWLLGNSDEPYRKELALPSQSEDGEFNTAAGGDDFEILDEDCSEIDNCGDDPVAHSIPNFGTVKSMQGKKRDGKSPIFVVVFYDDGSCENFSMR